jgi:iron complex outermembrane receptor protein
VGSTQYNSKNQEIDFAYRNENHLVQITLGSQNVVFEGFPNQRMDMTANTSTQINALYTGKFYWGDLEARIYDQATRHAMNMGPDRFSYGTLGMPMETEAKTTGVNIHGNVLPTEHDTIRVGIEYQKYTLYDWWPQAGGMMGPNTFWNIDFGQRDKLDSFAEWEARWNTHWLSQLGIRSNFVSANASPVQGYNAAPIWNADAATFNALAKQHTDYNWDLTAITQYTPSASQTFDLGFARKSHSPNLYQRYPWSTQPMATLMNNFVGDGNGYIGNVALNPEIANTLSTSGAWHDAEQERWNVKGTAYYTYVQDFIDARRCDFSQCGGAQNLSSTQGFVNLQYVNQNADLLGFDGSARKILLSSDELGQLSASGLFNLVRGRNLSSGDNLYNIMPLNTKLSLIQNIKKWTNTIEVQWVDAKKNVSQVRNEMPTSAYSLVNWRTSYAWKEARLDIAIDNVLNRFYSQPLGGAYVGQGASMTSNGIPWGVVVPGMGRSVNIAFHYYY